MAFIDNLQVESKVNLTNQILDAMENHLSNTQLNELNKSINKHISNIQVYPHTYNVDDFDKRNKELQKEFLKIKKLEGLSQNTIDYYEYTLTKFIEYAHKLVLDFSPDDLRDYFIFYKELNNASPASVNNIRRNLSSFYGWLELEEYILRNPMKATKPVKEPKRIKKPFSTEEVEILREHVHTQPLRDIAMFELLLSSGIRLSELESLNISDIDFDTQEFIVTGKGDKERKCYFGTKAKLALKKYLASRCDDNPALFVTLNEPHDRLEWPGIGTRVRDWGRNCGVNNTHPHRFRRTFASLLSKRKVPLGEIQKMLGHSNINTTLIYVSIDDDDLKLNYTKHMK